MDSRPRAIALRGCPRQRWRRSDHARSRTPEWRAPQVRLNAVCFIEKEDRKAMPQKISFGFTIPQRGVFFGIATWPEMLAMAREADRIALFDSVWVGDSVMAKPRPDSIALLGALAGATSRVKLGVGCMASFPIRDPIIFAYQWATLDLISNGRMLLAASTGIVAGGVSAKEGGAWNITDGQRGNRMAENIAICRRLWTEDDVTFTCKYRSLA